MSAFLRSRRGRIFLVVLIALSLRLYAAFQLPLDFDEPVYLDAAYDYAGLIRAGNFNGVIDYPQVSEHPPLVRLLYSLTMLPLGQSFGWSEAYLLSRFVSVAFGTLAVWVLAVLDPLAGLLLALQTYSVKYTSQAYLEALPLFAMLAALISLRFSKIRRDRWFWISAAALGLTAAGKYSYLPIVFVILYVYFFDKKYSWRDLIFYAGVAGVTFFIFDPVLWHDPLNRLYSSLFFHTQYAQGTHVQEVGYPWYQPLLWLSRSFPYEWHPGVFFYNPLEGILSIDGLIFLLAIAGSFWDWRNRERRFVVIWLVIGIAALLLWPTKWPQYTLVVIPAFCLAASTALKWIFSYFVHLEDYYGWVTTMIPMPGKVVWIALFLSVGFFATMTGVNAYQIYQAHQGWSHILQDVTPLPSNNVHAVMAAPGGRMVIGTEHGAVIWQPSSDARTPDTWQELDSTASPLPANPVTSLLAGPADEIWFGTENGIARYDGKSWEVFNADSLGLPQVDVHDMKVDTTGRVWVGTNSGAAVYDGKSWQVFTPQNSGLSDALVLSLAVRPTPAGDEIYFGTGNGLSRYLPASGAWEKIEPKRFNRQNGGVADLLVDSQDRLWVATLGSGLHVWNGANWQQYTVATSDIPTNRIDTIFEDQQGDFWIGASFPERPGGVLARFDGKKWVIYAGTYSGYSGGAAVSIAEDKQGRMWFGIQTMGVDIYDQPE